MEALLQKKEREATALWAGLKEETAAYTGRLK